MTNDETLHKWINGELSGPELESFKRRPEYESLAELYKNTESWAAPAFDADAMLEEILKKENSKPSPQQPGRRVFLSVALKYVAAASVVLIAGWFAFAYLGRQVHYEVAKGETAKGFLPDQSEFVLNAGSALSYNKWSWKKVRRLELSGEAFFAVRAGSTFTVETATGRVQVLGTKFNVWSRDGTLEVKCSEGKVAVLSQEDKLIAELGPGEAVRMEPGKEPDKYPAIIADNASWIQGITKLRKVPLAVVLQELERQFDVEIEAEGLDTTEVISCNFQHEDVTAALKTALSPLGVTFEVSGRKVYLKK